MSSGLPVFSMDEMSYSTRAFSHEYESSRSGSFHGRQGVYTRKQSLRPPSSSSSSTAVLDPGSSCRSRSDLFPVSEIPELHPAVKGDGPALKEGTHRLSVVKEEPGQTEAVQGDDARAAQMQTQETSQDPDNPYRNMVSVICLSADESSSEDGQ